MVFPKARWGSQKTHYKMALEEKVVHFGYRLNSNNFYIGCSVHILTNSHK